MFLLRLCVSSSVRASQTHHGESDRHGATGRKEDLHGPVNFEPPIAKARYQHGRRRTPTVGILFRNVFDALV
jgi:hypothetical protein